MINPQTDWNHQAFARRGEGAREFEALLWVAAGAAWAVVALRAWSQSKKVEARRHTFHVSNKILHQAFPRGIETP